MRNRNKFKRTFCRGAISGLLFISLADIASAQMNGHNLKGDMGLKSGTQAPPGVYAAGLFTNYGTDTVKNRFGETLNTQGDLSIQAAAGIFNVVAPVKALGANYGLLVVAGAGNPRIQSPRLDILANNYGIIDTYVQHTLGWHVGRVDLIAGYGTFMPTGRYKKDADDNIGLGMWTNEFSIGSTVFLDPEKKYHFSTTAFYEIHTKKKDQDLKVGDILTLEGGVGRDFAGGLMSTGVAYFTQWKMTPDGGSDFPGIPGIDRTKHQAYGVGPELVFPIANKKKEKLYALLTARYLWEFGNVTTTQGQTFVFAATFPLKFFK